MIGTECVHVMHLLGMGKAQAFRPISKSNLQVGHSKIDALAVDEVEARRFVDDLKRKERTY
jgi:hypothetical protein